MMVPIIGVKEGEKPSWKDGKYAPSESEVTRGSFDPKGTGTETNNLPKFGEAPRLTKAPKKQVPPDLQKPPKPSDDIWAPTFILIKEPQFKQVFGSSGSDSAWGRSGNDDLAKNPSGGSGGGGSGGKLPPNKRSALREVIQQLLRFFRPLGMFVAGAVYQYLRNIGDSTRWLFQVFNPLWNGQEQDVERGLRGLPDYNYFWWGQRLGDGAAIVTGILEIIAGGGAAAGGGFLCIAGFTCIGGAPAIVAGVALGLHGTTTLAAGVRNIVEELGVLYSQGTGGTGSQLYQKMTTPQLEKARNSYQELIQEHEKKLNDYIANPDAYDNDGRLKNAPNSQIRQQIIQGRINALQKQIKKQRDESIKIEQELNRRK